MRSLRTILFFVSALAIEEANAQVQYVHPTSRPISVTISGGATTLYGDVPDGKPFKPAGKLNVDYNITPFIAAGIEGQYGKMAIGKEGKAGELTPPLYMENTYYSAGVNARICVGQFNPYPRTTLGRKINNIYLGTGLGYLRAEHENITRNFPDTYQPIAYIKEEAKEWLVPVNIGINIDLLSNLTANINYQYNQCLGESLDAYNFNLYTHKVSRKDAYSLISIGLRMHLGKPRH